MVICDRNAKRFMRKSQISIILVIVVLIIVVGVIFYLLMTKPHDHQPPTNVKSIENYVQKCLANSVNSGFTTAMKQGAVIYKSQHGQSTLYPSSCLSYNGYHVLYYINSFDYSDFEYYNQIKDNSGSIFGFPFVCISYQCASCNSGKDYYAAYLNPIDKGQGVFFNSQNCSKTDVYRSPSMPITFKYNTFESNLKRDLSSYLNYSFSHCINDFSSYKNQYNIVVKKKPSFNVEVSNSRVNVVLNYPLEISAKGNSGTKTSLSKFSYSLKPLRLIDMLYFTNYIIRQDSSNISFNPDNLDFNGFRSNVVKNADGKGNLLFKVTDLKSKVNGENVELWFAARVRPPILNYFPQQVIILGPGGLLNLTNKSVQGNFTPFWNYINNCCHSSAPHASSPSCSGQHYNCSTVLEYYFNHSLLRKNGFAFFNATDPNGYKAKIITNFKSFSNYDALFNHYMTFQINASNGFLNSSKRFQIVYS